MIRKIGWLVLLGYIGLVIYALAIETGPIGWLNAWQVAHANSYSLRISATVIVFGATVLASPLILWLMAAEATARIGAEAARDPARLAAAIEALDPKLPDALSTAWVRPWSLVAGRDRRVPGDIGWGVRLERLGRA